MNVNILPMWICLSVFLYVLFIYMYVGIEAVTLTPLAYGLRANEMEDTLWSL